MAEAESLDSGERQQIVSKNTVEAMTEHPAPLAIVRTTDDLREVFRRRVAQLNISLETLDAIAGLPTRYSSKVLGLQPTRRFGQISFDGAARCARSHAHRR